MSHILEVTNLEVEFSGDGGKNISVDHVGFAAVYVGIMWTAKASQPCLSWDFWEKGAR